MKRRVVITGLGIVAPKARNKEEFWENLIKGRNCIDMITKCNIKCLFSKAAGQVPDLNPERYFKIRFLKKCDDFSIYSLLAIKELLDDAKLDLSEIDLNSMGIYVGNNYGGCKESQKGLSALYEEGLDYVSSFLASNWFPAAAQGHTSIEYGFKGFSKTIVADMASSNISIGNAYKIVQNGIADYMIAGGAEAPLATWGLLFYEKSNKLCFKNTDFDSMYQPFGKERDGIVLAEGAAYVLLESYENAKMRNARIYGEIKGAGHTSDGYHHFNCDINGKQYARAIRLALNNQKIIPDYISLGGIALDDEDTSEINGINTAFPGCSKLTCSCPKAFFGNSYGAAGAMDTVIACLSMKDNVVIKNGNVKVLANHDGVDIVIDKNREKEINSSLILSKGLGGINGALYIEKI